MRLDLFPEEIGFFGDDGAGLDEFGDAGGAVFLGDRREVVEIVEEDVVELRDRRLDIARESQIDEEQRTSRALANGGGGSAERHDGLRRGGGAHDDIEFTESSVGLLKRHGAPAESRRQFHGAFKSAACDGEGGRAAALKRFGRFFANVARADEENTGLGELAENGEREVNGDIGDADLAGRNGGRGADVLGGLEAFLKQTIQHRSGGASGLRRGVGVFDLTENFGFTDHLRVETGCDLEQVLDGVAAAEAQADFIEDVGIKILAGAKRRRDAGGGFRMRRYAVKLDAVTRAQHRELVETGDAGEFPAEGFRRFDGEGKFFPHFDGGTMVGGPNDKKSRSVHGLAAPLSGAWGAASGRRELTTSRESSARGKIRRHVRAKRRARRRPPSLRPRVIA